MPDSPRFSRILKVLECIAQAEHPARIAYIVDRCALPKATVHRICSRLREQEYLAEALSGKGLVPGPKLVALAEFIFANGAQSDSRHSILESLARRIGETCNISVPNGAHMRYVDRVETEWPLQVQLPVGSRVPLYCTASGKLYLSTLPVARRRRILERIDLEPRTAKTITDIDALDVKLQQIARCGFGTDDEEFIDGMIAVSVPVTDPTGRLFATLSFHAPVVRMSLETAKTHTGTMLEAARDLATDVAAQDPADAG